MRASHEVDLVTAERAELLDAWTRRFGTPPAKKLSSTLMRAALLFEAQSDAHGRISKKDRRRLISLSGATGTNTRPRAPIAPTGAHLVREWNGRTYQVAVVPGGYVLDGKTYRSLSAVAKHITGAHWSGPRFFGVSA